MSETRFADGSWQRLPWLIPAGSLLSLLALMGFLGLLMRAPARPPQPHALVVQLIELPAPAPAATAPPAEVPPPPPQAAPEPPPPEPETVAPAPLEHVPQPPPRRPPARPAAPRPPAPPAAAAPQRQPPAPAPPAGAQIGGGVSGARAIFQPMPELPVELRRHNVEWVAVARFKVAADGSAEVELVEPTSEPSLNRLLLATLKRWRFFPALDNGRPVASSLELRIPISVK